MKGLENQGQGEDKRGSGGVTEGRETARLRFPGNKPLPSLGRARVLEQTDLGLDPD